LEILALEREVGIVMDSLDGYEDGELTMREYNHRPKECNGSKDCDKENMRNIELCDALCRKK